MPLASSVSPFLPAALLVPLFACGTDRHSESPAADEVTVVAPAAPAPGGEPLVTAAGLEFQVPAGWVPEVPENRMRQAQVLLPTADGQDAPSTRLVVYHFGAGSGGGVEANLDRWIGQFAAEDGRAPKEAAVIEERTVNGLDVTTIDLTGRYVAETAPGSGVRLDEADHRLKGAIVDTPRGHFFLKLVGPAAVVDPHAAEFDALVESLRHLAG